MSGDAPIDPQRQADALIAEIHRKAAQAAHDARALAAKEAETIVRSARVKARRQLQRARADLRQARTRGLAQASAALETERRRRASTRALRQLAVAWPMLEAALERRWKDALARRRWIAGAIDLAQARLAAAVWRVRVAAEVAPEATADLRSVLAHRGLAQAAAEPDAMLRAGLVIECDGAVLDATVPALLVDRGAVEGALLAEIERGAER